MGALNIRVGDVVRLLDFKVTEVGAHFITGDYVGGSQGYTYPSRYVAEVISHAETDAEKIARLEAELAGLLNDVKAVEAAYEAELAKAPRRIEWGGGSCPTDKAVVIWQRNGKTSQAMGYAFDWRHHSEPDDIIAYMVLPS